MKKWDTFQIVFMAFCASLNVGVGAIVGLVKLPIYLDSIGTIVAAALGGWLYGAIVGLLALIAASIIIAPTAWAYGCTAIAIALVSSLLIRYKFLRSLPMTIFGGLVIGICAALVSSPITTYLYGGVSLVGSDAVTAFLKAMGNSLMESVILGGLATDPVDKLISCLIAFGLLKVLPKRIYYRFQNGKFFLTEKQD